MSPWKGPHIRDLDCCAYDRTYGVASRRSLSSTTASLPETRPSWRLHTARQCRSVRPPPRLASQLCSSRCLALRVGRAFDGRDTDVFEPMLELVSKKTLHILMQCSTRTSGAPSSVGDARPISPLKSHTHKCGYGLEGVELAARRDVNISTTWLAYVCEAATIVHDTRTSRIIQCKEAETGCTVGR